MTLTSHQASTDTGADAAAIELLGLRKQFGKAFAVDGVDLAVPAGSFLVLLGPSGCGKTTTLRMLAGLESPTGGEIRVAGRVVASGEAGVAVAPGHRDTGLVFQSYALWPHMTVRANVEWPLKVAKQASAQRRQRVDEVLDLLSVGELAARYPGEISGGQQQRVAIARMIGPKPSVLLFDEPLSNLDAKLRVETRGELLRVHRATGATSVYVTHDQVEAMTMATHVALMRDGVIEQFGAPQELLARPATSFVASFIGTPPANVLSAQVREGALVRDGVVLADRVEVTGATDAVDVMYRADSLALGSGPGDRMLPMEYAEATPLAGRYVVTGWQAGSRISLVTVEAPQARLGDELWVRLPGCPDAIFDATTGARLDGVHAATTSSAGDV